MPKGVYYSHRQLVLHTLAVASALGNAVHGTFDAGDVYMPITPMFHVHAWGLPYVATLLGVKQVYPGRYVPDTLLGLIAREKVTFSHCVPTILQMMLASPASADGRLAGWKVVIGGSALPLALARTALERHIDLFAGYGMSETGPILTLAHLKPEMDGWDPERKLPVLCRRRPADPVRAGPHRRRSDERRPRDGRARARSSCARRGSRRATSASRCARPSCGAAAGCTPATSASSTRTATQDRRPHQGRREDGRRVGVVARRRGPDPACAGHRGGRRRRRPDERWGERPVALVVAKAGYCPRPTADAIRAHIASHAERGDISRYAVPDRVEFVDAIPKTSVGKLDKKLIRASLIAACEPTRATSP
jgi:fatty-acyl-CoA synthase